MTRQEVLNKLISIRHYCFLRGVLEKFADGRADHEGRGTNGDFVAAFREVNRLYVLERDNKHVAAHEPGYAVAA